MKGIEVAKQHLGQQEIRDRSALINFFKANNINCDPKTTPWCAAFINATERSVGNKGTGSLAARSFLKYGTKVEEDDALEGDIVIFARGSNGYSGHVTYFVKWDDDNNTVIVLGGNQSDMVCYSHYSQDRIIGIRRS